MLYSKEIVIMHAIWLPFITVVSVGLYFLLRNKSVKAKLIPFMVIAAIIVVLEIAKQIYEFSDGDYGLFSVPLHVCSVFIFSLPLAVFLKQKWFITKVFWALSVVVGVVMALSVLIGPGQIMDGGIKGVLSGTAFFLDWHTVFFHYLIVMFVVLAIIFKPYKPQWKHLLCAGAIYGVFMGLSALISRILFEAGL
ncbi:MAG: YwaF family protein, partial [Firmicutes bacterium]|nr:YwaF family protein [Bacillota bacterium]